MPHKQHQQLKHFSIPKWNWKKKYFIFNVHIVAGNIKIFHVFFYTFIFQEEKKIYKHALIYQYNTLFLSRKKKFLNVYLTNIVSNIWTFYCLPQQGSCALIAENHTRFYRIFTLLLFHLVSFRILYLLLECELNYMYF